MTLDLLLGTLLLRPYVLGFLVAFVVAGTRDLGWRRMLLFGACVSPLVWMAEMSSTRTGIPFGLYHYTGDTRGRELFLADVPVMDPMSFAFLTYAAFCLARATLRGRRVGPLRLALATGGLMMVLDLVIDPAAVRGDRWFLGRIFFYAEEGVYFGVPLQNFAGWALVGAAGSGLYLAATRAGPLSGVEVGGPGDAHGHRFGAGVALYYAVLAFNLAVTAWIGEWLLLATGVGIHVVTAVVLWTVRQRPAVRLGLEKQRA